MLEVIIQEDYLYRLEAADKSFFTYLKLKSNLRN